MEKLTNDSVGVTKMIPTKPVQMDSDSIRKVAEIAETETKATEADGTTTKAMYPTTLFGTFHWTDEGNIVISLMNGMDLLVKVKEEQTVPDVTTLDQESFEALLAKTKKLGWATAKVNRYNDTGAVVKYNHTRKERFEAMQAKESEKTPVEKTEA